MKFVSLYFYIALVFSTEGDQKPPEEKMPKSSVIGVWRLIDTRLDKLGVVVGWEFTSSEIIVRIAKNKTKAAEVSRARYVINTKKSPKWITVEIDDSLDEISEDKRLGIFRIKNGELHLKQEISDGGDRPEDFVDGYKRFKQINK